MKNEEAYLKKARKIRDYYMSEIEEMQKLPFEPIYFGSWTKRLFKLIDHIVKISFNLKR